MVYTTYTKSGRFDVEATVYESYAKNLEKLGIFFMISGHQHVLALLGEDDERNTAPHSFPVIVGSAVENIGGKKDLVGTAMILNSGSAEFLFTDTAKNVRDRFTIKF
jgi:hemerythrin superfamily protein